jgi:signal transduction histidine kinase/ActR/RegA family two-component response regulator
VTDFVRLQERGTQQEALTGRLRERTAAMETEILLRSRELHEANTKLRAASKAKDEFLSRMSHELRTPLTSILGFSDLLRRSELDDEKRQWAEIVLKAGQHLLRLVDDLLDLSKIEADQLSLSAEPLPLQPLLEQALELMQPVAEAHEIALHPPRVALDSGWVVADSRRLQQVLLNLISNAVKYNREGGDVRIDVIRSAPERIRITVEDTGAGIDEVSLAKLFQPFERLGAAAAGIEGTGLGLAVSRRLVEAMGGRLDVSSTVGVGSRFHIELLRTEPAAVTDLTAEDGAALARRSYAQERRLLYIEDTVANVRLIESIVDRRPSIQLVPAMLGQLGLDLARDLKPDLIVLDLHLPDLSGEQVFAALQAGPSTREIPVVILSADATAQQRDRMLEAGAHAYLTKPIAVMRFLEVLDEVLDTA